MFMKNNNSKLFLGFDYENSWRYEIWAVQVNAEYLLGKTFQCYVSISVITCLSSLNLCISLIVYFL